MLTDLIAGLLSICQAAPGPCAPQLPPVHTSIVITASPLQPDIDRRNAEIFTRTLFSRDDQIFHVLDAGIDAGQHEGGGKSIEIRRFGFNLDHTPEFVQDVSIVNGPFSAEYGDFSGLGVVHIRLRESLADNLTLRLQSGSPP
ncbi:MAG: hypothetical protein HYS04_02865 [Acidobacteria bacterium]|nr:hypothetical protein [Acidobacteriota bacterium]